MTRTSRFSAQVRGLTVWTATGSAGGGGGGVVGDPDITLTAINPTSTATGGGSVATLTGSNYVGPLSVTFGGTSGTGVGVVNGSTATCTIPSRNTASAIAVVVQQGTKSATLSNFTYYGVPTITAVNPTSGVTLGGTVVTITGTQFISATAAFGGTAATGVNVVTSSSLTCLTPASANTGAVDVTVTTASGVGTSAGGYTYGTSAYNEPAGYTEIATNSFSSAVTNGGWELTYDPSGLITLGTDAAAPLSASSVGVGKFPLGFTGGGSAPFTLRHTLADIANLYVRCAIKFSDPWYGHDASAVNKIFYLTFDGGNPIYVEANGGGNNGMHLVVTQQGVRPGQQLFKYDGCAQMSLSNEVSPTAAQAEIVRGQWHRLEMSFVGGTSATSDGGIHAWIDGTKVLQYTSLMMLPTGQDGFTIFRWDPVYGGTGGSTVPQDQFQYIDEIYLSTG